MVRFRSGVSNQLPSNKTNGGSSARLTAFGRKTDGSSDEEATLPSRK
jgi:hypothetical protein